MGKRKERRLAALSNAGRRVKLDLFAEPTGDLDGSDVHEEIGGDLDSRQRTKIPKSASSSGPQTQNPLLLLEQYSDDDIDEDLKTNSDHDGQDALSPDCNNEVATVPVQECENMDSNAGEDLAAQKAVQEESERGTTDFSENLESRDEVKTDTNEETDLIQTSVPATSNIQVVGDASSGWRIVMHEESHNYYYWNVETGETSWEVPDVVLAQAQPTQSTTDIKTSPTQVPENVSVFKQESVLTNGGKLDTFSAESTGGCFVNVNDVELFKYRPKVNDQIEGYKNGGPVCASQGSEVDQSYTAFSTCSSDVNITKAGSEIYADCTVTNEELKSGLDLPLHLVNWSASLLERLKSLQKSGGHEWTSKYIFEAQIRLSDFKSLLSYNTSLLPFWEHSKKKLKQIEDDINKEIYQTAVSLQSDEAKATDISKIVREENFQERSNVESEVERVENSVSALEHSHLPADSTSLTLQGDKSEVTAIVNGENISSSKAIEHLGNSTGVIEHASEAAIDEMSSKTGAHSVEDVDMEVDMEVEDASSAGNLMMAVTSDISVAKSFTSLEQPLQLDPPAQPNFSFGYASLVPEDDGSLAPPPPPPDEEWIPPPPPDNEDVPPPPPDEPAEPLYPLPPSYTQLGQPLCYTEPYQVPYPDSSFIYGVSVPEVPSANFYGHPEACNVVMAQAPFYYEAVPNSYPGSAPIVVNGVLPEGYGILQDATASVPVFSSAESSQLHADSSSVRFDASASIQFGSSDIANMNTTSAITETDKGRGETTTASFRPSTSGSPTNDVLPTSNAVTDSSAVSNTSAVAKAQPKALRSKKRTVSVAPSLRSNKKVSSLLDKWKAAKEELEDEEEPENAYEILERKREREIKEWHAQQIASGEAKENANFQPLGGDWRERVKRRRAQSSSSEVTKPTFEASADANQQPDLAEISKDLPSGWQAYWDESSKQVYYGNVNTSETSWTKPTK